MERNIAYYAARPIYDGVTYMVTVNPWPDDATYNPSVHGVTGIKTKDETYGCVIEYGTRPVPFSSPYIGSFNELGEAINPDGSIDADMTKRIHEYEAAQK